MGNPLAGVGDHRFSSLLEEHGLERESRAGMRDMIKALRRHALVEAFLLDHADRLRQYRNPFVHLQPPPKPNSTLGCAMRTRIEPARSEPIPLACARRDDRRRVRQEHAGS